MHADAAQRLSDAEARFEAARRRIGLWLGPLAAALLLAFPIPGISPEAQRLSAVLALAVIFWITEAIPMAATALLAPALCIPLGIADDKAILAPFASPSIFLFIGSFFLAEAMRRHGLDQRIALWLLTRRGVTRSPFTLFAALGSMTAILSMWMSNVATTAMMLPVATGVLNACPGLRDNRRLQCDLVLLIAFAASVGGLGTPVGTPPNIIAMGFLKKLSGDSITFLDWMKIGVPLVFVLTAFLLWWLRPKGVVFTDRAAMDADLLARRSALGPLTPGQLNTAVVFSLAVFLWMWPGLVELTTGQRILGVDWMSHYLKEETVGLLAGLSLFLLPTNLKNHQFTLTWEEAVGIDWGTIFLFAGGLALGTQIFATGLADAMGRSMSSALGQPSLWSLVAAGVILSIILSEATSNTASANVMVPLFIILAGSASLPQRPVALAVSLACSFGFMLPVSTGPNAMAYSTGLVPLPRMIRAGIALDIVGAIAVWLAVRLLS